MYSVDFILADVIDTERLVAIAEHKTAIDTESRRVNFFGQIYNLEKFLL